MNKHDDLPGFPPGQWYEAALAGQGLHPDAAQSEAIRQLDELWRQLVEFKSRRSHFLGRSLLSPKVPLGLYLWGGVGRGKTFLMDAFYHCLPYKRKRRIHFHPFMAEVHHEMKLLANHPDPLIAVADMIEKSTRVLCLDEFHIDDIADAMIMGRLLKALFERGVVLLTTSNYPPEKLYPHGLQRELFLPAIDLLKEHMVLVHMSGSHDYRLLQIARESLYLVPDDAKSDARMEALFRHMAQCEPRAARLALKHENMPVIGLGRAAAWFDFEALCGGNHDQSDYLEIAHRFKTVFLSHIPLLGPDDGAKARRFTWLIDVLYDHRVKLVAQAAAMPGALFSQNPPDNDAMRTASRVAEMQTRHYLDMPHIAQIETLN